MLIVIAGGTGFIGRIVSTYLREQGHHVVQFSRSNGFDVLDPRSLGAWVGQAEGVINCVVNTGDRVSPGLVRDNLMLCYEVFQACADEDVPLLQISSCEVYGNLSPEQQAYVTMHEEFPRNPTCAYAVAKDLTDQMCLGMVRVCGLNARIARLFNPYGPSQTNEDRVIRRWWRQIRNDQPITMYGDGSDFKDWVYETDIAAGIWEAQRLGKGAVVNLASGRTTTNLEIATMMAGFLGRDLRVDYQPYPEKHNHLYRQRGSTEKAASHLGWAAHVPAEIGLAMTVAGYEGEQ